MVQAEQLSKTYEDVETEVDSAWFVENASHRGKSGNKNRGNTSRSTAMTPADTGDEGRGQDSDDFGGGMNGEQVGST
jgi:hypothetical protein